jgi:putative FmdB family regulatory protein
MPTYEYACKDCGEHLEVVQSFKDDALTECPSCSGNLRKVFSAAGIIFKGSGWHVKDYAPTANRSGGRDGTSSGDGDGASTKDGSGSGDSASGDSGSSSKAAGDSGKDTGTSGSKGSDAASAKDTSSSSSSSSSPEKKSA